MNEKLSAGISANYINSGGSRIQRGSNVRGVMLGLLRTSPTFDNGNGKTGREAADDRSTYLLPDGSQRSYRAGVYDNPYWTVNKNPYQDDVNRMIGYTSFKYEPFSWLAFQYKLGIDNYSERTNQAQDIGASFNGILWNPGFIYQETRTYRDINSDFLILLNHQLSPDLGLSATLGHNYFSNRNVVQWTQADNLSSPDFYHISNGSDLQTGEGIAQRKLVGAFGTVDLNYKEFLFLNITGRNDWSSALPENDNTFQSYSASLGFAFTEVFGLQNNPVMPYGKLRVSYGQVGNDAPIYSTLNYFGSAASGGDGFISGLSFPVYGVNAFERNNTLGNDKLVPETTTTFEVGGEFRFWKGRIGLDVTYFDQESTDQIIGVQVSAATGFTNVTQNAGKITSKGLEVVLGITPVKNENFSWDIDANFTQIENDVIELAEGVEQIGLEGFTSTQSVVIAGEPYGAIWGDVFQRNDQGQLLLNADGYPVIGPNKEVIGDPNPDFTLGLRNSFNIGKDLRVSALLDIREGGDMWCGTCGILDYFGTSQRSAETRDQTVIFEGILPDGSVNTKPVPYLDPAAGYNAAYFRRYGFGGITEMNMYETSWVRLREVSLSYSLPASITEKAPFSGLVLTLTGRNLWLDTDYNFPEETTNNWWRTGAYAGSLKSASVIIEKAAEEGQPYYAGIAKIMMAESYGMLTIFMGDIPFSDALKGTESLKPVYDTQEQVWQGILNMLDDAISDLSQAPVAGAPAGDDLIFGGDAEAWIKTAHALKARYYIQGTKRDNGAANQALQEVNQAFSSVAEAPFFYYDVSEIGNNPLAKFGKERPATLGIDERFAQQMSDKSDPRQPFYMNEAAGGWEYFNSTLSNLIWAQDDSAIPIISYAELMFIKAEALLRTGGSDADVQQALKDGIAASMEQVGLAADQYMTYVDAYGDLSGLGSTEEKLQRIIEEAYFAYFGYAFQQTWNNFRRTGYPNLQPSALGSSGLNPSGVIPRRMLYPVSEVQTNSENLNAAKGRQKGALLDADMWLFE